MEQTVAAMSDNASCETSVVSKCTCTSFVSQLVTQKGIVEVR